MAKKKKKNNELTIPGSNLNELQSAHIDELNSNPKYSLEVDPSNKYNLSDIQKQFILNYVNFKNVNTAAEVTGYVQDDANKFFASYACQQEIRRLNMALYQRRFASKLISIDQIGGYLSSMLTDEYVPLAEQLSPSEKLRVIDTIIKINELKANAFNNPGNILHANIDEELKNMTITTIQQMIVQSGKPNKNNEVIIETLNNNDVLSPEEKAYLETLPTNELIKLANSINKEGGEK